MQVIQVQFLLGLRFQLAPFCSGDKLIGYFFSAVVAKTGCGEEKAPAMDSAGNKLSGCHRLL